MMSPTLRAHLAPVLLAACAAGSPSHASERAAPAAALPAAFADPQSVTTVSTRWPQATSTQVADVVVITRQEIEGLPADNLADVLQQRAGIQVSRTGGTGQPTSVLLRGASASSTVVLVDGVRVGSGTTGQFDFSTLGLAGIERIEVLRGPGSSLHGADAVGGVVLITTRSGVEGQSLRLRSGVGSLGSRDVALEARAAQGALQGHLMAAHQSSQGVSAVRPGDRFGNHNPDADGYARQSLQWGGAWTAAAGQRVEAGALHTRLASRYDGSEYRPPNFAQDASPDFRTDTTTQAAFLRGQGQLSAAWGWGARVARGLDDSTSGANDLYRYRTRRDEGGLQLAWTPGADTRWVLAWDRQTERVAGSGYDGPAQRDNEAWTLTAAHRAGAVSLQADGRMDRNSVYGSHSTGRTGVRWELDAATGVRVLAATTFRAPSFNELFFPGYGVAALKPEEGRSLEAGVSRRTGRLSSDVTVWRNHVDNLIAYTGNAARCPAGAAYAFGCAANIGQARLKGLTYEGRWHRAVAATGGPAPLSWGWDITDAKDEAGKPLPRRARHQVRLQADHHWGPWRLGATGLWQSRREEGGVALRGGQRVDLQASRALGTALPGWSLQLRLLNALDADIEPARDYRSPGRQAWVGLSGSIR